MRFSCSCQAVLEWLHRRIVLPVKNVLASGITPSGLASALAFGVSGGLFPIPFATTLVCLLPVFLLRVNPVIIQVVNLTLTPAQVALIPVFVNFGGSIVLLFNSDATTEDVSVSAMIDALKSNFLEAMGVFKDILLYAFLGWVVFSIVAIPVIYFAATPLLAYGLKRWRKRKAAMSPSESQIFSNGEDDVDDMDGLEESEEIDIKGIETGAGVAMKPLRQPSMSASSDRRGSFLGGATSAAVTPRVDDGAINARNGGGDGSLLHDNNNEIDTLVDDNADQQPLLAGDGHSN